MSVVFDCMREGFPPGCPVSLSIYLHPFLIGFDIQHATSLNRLHTAISIKVVPRAKRKSLIRARKAAGNR